MKIIQHYRVKSDKDLDLKRISPGFDPEYGDKKNSKEDIRVCAKRLRELQYLLYAENQRGLLICLQAMDTGGKDGTIRHVLGYMNPLGCRVKSFKQPSADEAAHDFLWRIHKEIPALGEVVIFNRSHYEDVLVTRVHGLVTNKQCQERYEAINAFEKNLSQSNIHILKFYLHISKDEQLKRFNDRLEDPSRHWKISEADYTERAHWGDYQHAYEDALTHCSTEWAPWFIIPADNKWFRNLIVSRIVVEYLEGLDMKLPMSKVDIEEIKRKFSKA